MTWRTGEWRHSWMSALADVGTAAEDLFMTRYGIDSLTAIRILREGVIVHPDHQLVAPARLRSDALSYLYRAVRRDDLDRPTARTLLSGITTMRIRLLGDRVSRAGAWKLADELDWDDTSIAEYVSVARLQADAFVTVHDDLAERIRGVVTLAPFDALSRR